MKKLLIGLLVGIMLFSTIPAYALTVEEANEFVDKYVLVTFVYNHLFGTRTSGSIGKVLSIYKIDEEGYLFQTYLVILELNGSVAYVRIDRIKDIQEIDPFNL